MMENLPYFFNLLKNNRVIKLTDSDLAGLTYTRNTASGLTLKNFKLHKDEKFNKVVILMSSFGVLIDFISRDTKYFDNASTYFNTKAVARSKPPYIKKGKVFTVKGKRIGTFNMFSGTVHCAVMQSKLYGCKIMTSFYFERSTVLKGIATDMKQAEF
jgi:hypothetical protein